MSVSKTKAQILQGTKRQESFYLPELDWHMMLRPLTDGEASEVEGLLLTGQRVTVGERTAESVSVEIASFQAGYAEACARAVAYAITDEDWTVEEVKSLPRGDRSKSEDSRGPIEKIASKVFEISDVSLEAVSSFRDQRGGAADSETPSDGNTASDDPSGADDSAG